MLFSKLSDKDKVDIVTTIEHYLVNDGYSVKEATEEAQFILDDFSEGVISLTLWDALGCDDAGLVQESPNLQRLVASISADMAKSQKQALKH